MNLDDYKVVFIVVGLVGNLLFAIPALSLIINLPEGEEFSDLYVLGPGHMLTGYPFNVSSGVDYLVYVGVGNHLGRAAYYNVTVKFRNQTDPLPNSTSATPSSLSPLYTYRLFIDDNGTIEVPLTFSFVNVSYSGSQSTVGTLVINSVSFSVNKPAVWDSANNGTYYQIFMELGLYDARSDTLSYNNRFVSLWLNMTAPV
jgi:uncharacterized membrane protein